MPIRLSLSEAHLLLCRSVYIFFTTIAELLLILFMRVFCSFISTILIFLCFLMAPLMSIKIFHVSSEISLFMVLSLWRSILVSVSWLIFWSLVCLWQNSYWSFDMVSIITYLLKISFSRICKCVSRVLSNF